MKRFTQYLYEYQKEKKIRNIGFVKAEQGETSCVLQLQGRGLEVQPAELKVYLFYSGENGYEAVYQGAISQRKPMLNYRLKFTDSDIGNAKAMEDILGVMLVDAGGRRFAAVWNGEMINVDEIATEVPRPAVQDILPEVPRPAVQEILPEVEAEAILEEMEDEDLVEVSSEVETEEVDSEIAEQQFQNVYEKIQRKDLARLPRRDWRMANNNFLLHGFYNYHHLLWIEEDGELYIGVPGVRHAREIQAAQVFGFAQFRYAAEIMQDSSEDEGDRREDFGYFCRRIVRNE